MIARGPSAIAASSAAHHYELRAVGLLALGGGMLGLDRFVINPLFPVIARDLGLDYGELGLIAGVLSLTWGLSALLAGGLADRVGPKRVLVPALLIFSLLSAGTGLAVGLLSLLMLRGAMGAAEGAYMPAAIISTVQASKPSRVGMNIGVMQMAIGLFGLGLGPILATQALAFLPSWRPVFCLVAAPGLLLAALLQRVLRSRPADRGADRGGVPSGGAPRRGSGREVLRVRNIPLAAIAMACWVSMTVVLGAFMPNYLTDYLGLTLQQMGFAMSSLGLGSVVGMVGLSALADRLGYRRVIVGSAVLLLASLWWLGATGPQPARLFALLGAGAMLCTGALSITVGPLTVGSVRPERSATATGLVMGFGEIVGGAVMPALAGAAANRFGIQIVMPIVACTASLGLLVALFGLREPGPSRANASQPLTLPARP